MLATVLSSAVHGIDALLIEVEVDLASGLPQMAMVGLPEGAVRESKDRVRSALKNSGYEFPQRKITVNLAPADVKKEGSAFDLPIALGILAAAGHVPQERLREHALLGELSLNGQVKHVRGALPVAAAAERQGLRGVLLPPENAAEAAVIQGIDILPVTTLAEAFEFLRGEREVEPVRVDLATVFESHSHYEVDFNDVKGQEHVKRGLEVAAAGGHNVIMVGPPGSGKTMLARRLPTILPAPTLTEAIETTRVHSVMGLLDGRPLVAVRPFRAPHHTTSDAGLIGGGTIPKPGEVSLAHHGVLFLDELPEFRKNVLEVLRQPLEERRITISRAVGSITYPANVMLIAAMNPCPCGFLGDPQKECICTLPQIQRYRARVSGPLLDRIDIQVEVPAVRYKDLADRGSGEPSAAIRARVDGARKVQLTRFDTRAIFCNAQMTPRDLRRHCAIDGNAEQLLEMAMNKLALSARAYTRILKVARTIADLEGSEGITATHVSEAIQYRSLDRQPYG
jgi:magnesium chelatase family protein